MGSVVYLLVNTSKTEVHRSEAIAIEQAERAARLRTLVYRVYIENFRTAEIVHDTGPERARNG